MVFGGLGAPRSSKSDPEGMWDLPGVRPKALNGRVHIVLHAIGLPVRQPRDPSGSEVASGWGFPRSRGPVHYLTSLQETRELATKLQDCSIQDWKRLEAIKPPDQDFKTGGKVNNLRSLVAPGGGADIYIYIYIYIYI